MTQAPLNAEPTPGPEEPTAGRRWLAIGLIVVGIIAAAYLVAVLSTLGGIPSGTTVAGIDIGGQSEDEAAATLETGLAEIAAAPITVTARQSEATFEPSEVGLAPDYSATAEAAAGPIFDPAQLFKHLTGQTVEVAPVVSYDSAAMDAAVEQFATTADQMPVEPAITMSAQPTVEPGTAGEGIDRGAAIDLVATSYLFTTGPLALPVATLTPAVSDEEAQKVKDEFAVPAVSGPVPVNFGTGTDSLTVDTTIEGLSFAPEGSTLQPQLNIDIVRAGLPALTAAESPGTNATWDVSSGTPVVVPSQQGKGVANDQLTSELIQALPASGSDRAANVDIVATDPALTTEQAQALNITEQLSSFTQKFDYAEYRKVNVGQAAEYMNGVVLKPDDVYSMNGTIHERTEANGYVEGTFISNGRFEQGLGGGVSIATTATWTAAFFAGLEDIEVNPHSLYISRYQPGLEATVAWGQLDLRFKNDTGNGVLITTSAGDTFITVTTWGTKVYDEIQDVSSDRYNVKKYSTVHDDSPDCSAQGGVNGFTIDVWRVFIQGGQEVKREKFTTNYDPTTQVVCVPKAAPSPAPTPSG